MKQRIVSCCIAALTFAACQDPPTPTPRPRVTVAPPVVKPPEVTVPTPKIEEPADTLALKHDQPGVDHLARAKQLSNSGDRTGALTEARRAVFSGPTDPEVLEVTAKLAQQLGNHPIAAEAWGRLGQARTEDALPYVQQARELLKAKEYDRAVTAGQLAIARDAGNPEGYQAAGLGHLSLGELPQAISMFEKAVELKPDHGWALNNLGLAYLRANENVKAVEVLTKAADVLPAVAYVHNNLGVALERVGRKDEAKESYLTATTLSPKYVKARINAERVARAGNDQPMDADGAEPVEGTMSDIPHAKSDFSPEN